HEKTARTRYVVKLLVRFRHVVTDVVIDAPEAGVVQRVDEMWPHRLQGLHQRLRLGNRVSEHESLVLDGERPLDLLHAARPVELAGVVPESERPAEPPL